jgi:hypothetical protein
MNFSKFMVHEFFEIHGPWFFEIQCPTIFCDFGFFNSLAQAGGGGPYYMIKHYQKHTVLHLTKFFGIQCPTIFCETHLI